MSDRSYVIFTALAGALIGGAAGFLLLTERGRRLRAELQPTLANFMSELQELQNTASQVRESATQGWQRVEHLVNALVDQQSSFSGGAHDRSH
jgi:gas vesicle protein